MTLFELTETIYPWYIKSKDSGTGAYIRYTSSNYSLFRPASSFVVQSGCISVNTDSMLYGSGCFTAYTSVDWLEYYLNGGTGVFYDDTGAVYNAVSQDALLYSDNEAAYKALMDSYNNLAAQVADGTYTLSEISDLLSAEIAENIEYIASEEAAQTGYLKSIMESNNSIADAVSSLLSICESINDKLSSLVALSTVDTVADTVTALTSLVTAAEDFVDDLVDDVLDGVYDSVLDGLVDSGYYSDLLSSFKTSFPFSLPYDFFLIVNLLAHDPVEPQITWRMKLDSIGYDEIYSFDVSAFDSVVSVIRVFSSLLFIIALIKITMRLRKKE